MNGKGLTGRALGEAVIEHVLTFPEQHNQGDVLEDTPCGTVGCIAGWTVALHYGFKRAIAFYSRSSVDPAFVEAPALLGLNEDAFGKAVFGEMDRHTAISNLKHLLDETYSEPTS